MSQTGANPMRIAGISQTSFIVDWDDFIFSLCRSDIASWSPIRSWGCGLQASDREVEFWTCDVSSLSINFADYIYHRASSSFLSDVDPSPSAGWIVDAFHVTLFSFLLVRSVALVL